MTAKNFEALIITLLERRPFHPFTIQLHEGKRFEIDHPHSTVVRDGFAVYIAPGGTPVWFDHNSVVTVSEDIAGASA